MQTRRVVFVYFDGCEVLDFAGPLQTFHETNSCGGRYQIEHCAASPTAMTAQRLQLASLAPLPVLGPDDLLFVPGYHVPTHRPPSSVIAWLKTSYSRGATLCSVCTGSFALGEAGLLEGRSCTTHWKRTAEMAQRFPRTKVLADRLVVEDGRILSSAGVASGIDLALAIVERHHGPLMASQVARELVVYIRRDAAHAQKSVYLDFRTHLQPAVHAVQDWLIAHPSQRVTIETLARMAHMSPRNLTRAFREATGISIQNYRSRLRLEHARTLMNDPELTIEGIAAECGFADARQFRRMWHAAYQISPSQSRNAGRPLPPPAESCLIC